MNVPHDEHGGSPQQALEEFNKFVALSVGSGILAVIVLVLTAYAKVPWLAAIGYWVLAAVSLGIALFLLVTWEPFYKDIAHRAGSPTAAERLLNWFRQFVRNLGTKWPLRLLKGRRIDRPTLGLWIPFILSLLAVGWLVYFSGGIVTSPFASVPIIMFTLVVLLIDVPSDATGFRRAEGGDAGLIFPFKVLVVVAVAFFGVMTALHYFPWSLDEQPTATAKLAMTLATAVVGITYAAMVRFDILSKALDSRQPSNDGHEVAKRPQRSEAD